MTFSGRLYFPDPAAGLTAFTNTPAAAAPQKSRFDFNRNLDKCCSGGFSGLVFSENLLNHKELPDYMKITTEAGLTPVFHIPAPLFLKRKPRLLELSEQPPPGLHISFTNSRDLPLNPIQSFPKSFLLFTFVLTKHSVLDPLPDWVLENTELYCPYKRFMTDPFLTPRQVYRFLKKQSVPLKPFQGNIYDETIPPDMDLEPVIRPFIKNSAKTEKPLSFSVIIPSYNNKKQLLKHFKTVERSKLSQRQV